MKVSDMIKNKFIILSLIAYLIYFIIAGQYPPQNENTIYITFLNLINSLGAFLLVTGLYDVVLKEKFQEETTKNFVKTLLLENEYLKKFTSGEIKNMILKLEKEFINENKNSEYKTKIIKFINENMLPMGAGESKNVALNTFFEYYNEEIIYEESKNTDFIRGRLLIKYKLVNNSDNETSQTIFTKKSYSRKVFDQYTEPIKVKKLEITIDNKDKKIYSSDELKSLFVFEKDSYEPITITSEDNTGVQIRKKHNGKNIEFKENFKNYIIVNKELEIIIPYDDVTYGHTFHRPMLNYKIRFTDKNSQKVLGRLNSAFHKKEDDTITIRNLEKNVIEMQLNDDLLLPKESIHVVSFRKGVYDEMGK